MRFVRALWADKSLMLLAVPPLVLVVLFVAVRAGEVPAHESEAAADETATTAPVAANSPEAAAEVDATATDGFAAEGVTVTDDQGNLVRVPRGSSTGSASSSPADIPGAVVAGQTIDAAPTGDSTADDGSAPDGTGSQGAGPGGSGGSTTTTQPGSTTTTTAPVDPPPAVPESPVTALLPVSAALVGGIGWVMMSRRRRARSATGGPG